MTLYQTIRKRETKLRELEDLIWSLGEVDPEDWVTISQHQINIRNKATAICTLSKEIANLTYGKTAGNIAS